MNIRLFVEKEDLLAGKRKTAGSEEPNRPQLCLRYQRGLSQELRA
jgi:hypothetical protein